MFSNQTQNKSTLTGSCLQLLAIRGSMWSITTEPIRIWSSIKGKPQRRLLRPVWTRVSPELSVSHKWHLLWHQRRLPSNNRTQKSEAITASPQRRVSPSLNQRLTVLRAQRPPGWIRAGFGVYNNAETQESRKHFLNAASAINTQHLDCLFSNNNNVDNNNIVANNIVDSGKRLHGLIPRLRHTPNPVGYTRSFH